jgi:uncharacterized protein (TIGR00369 family)
MYLVRPTLESPLGFTLDVRLLGFGPERVSLQMPIRPDISDHHGMLHGGAVAALIDMAAGTAVLFGDGGGMRKNGTVAMTVQLLEEVRLGDVLAEAVVLRRGRTLCLCEVKVTDDSDRLVATGLVTYRIDS